MNPFAQQYSSEEIKKECSLIPEDTKKKLFSNAIKSNWQEVINIYRQHPEAHSAKITRSGDTALHMAISDGQESIVEELVSVIVEKTGPTALEIQNEHGNTPLHMAAYMGRVRMCRCIATKDSKLIGIQNNITETPFFLAVVHGRKDAFLCMHQYLGKEVDEGYRYYRRSKDGRTILHSAISGEYFDLAFQIIHLYPGLKNLVDEHGITPLHILATKPSAFRSGSHMKRFHKLIYHCVFVKKLKSNAQGRQDEDYAENCQTSFGLVRRLRNKIQETILGQCHRVQQMDAEDPNGRQQFDHKQGHGWDLVPKKCSTCFHRLTAPVFRVILDLVSITIRNIVEEKKKHTWSVQIMEKLLEDRSPHEYEYGGASLEKDGETAPYTFGDGGISTVGFSRGTILTEPEQHMVHDDHSPQPPPENSLKANQNNRGEPNYDGTIGKVTVVGCSTGRNDKAMENDKKKSSSLIVTKQGIIEMVEKIIETIGVAIKDEKKKEEGMGNEKKESPILIAAKHGIIEMVKGILEKSPVAIHDTNSDGKNIVLLVVENRQPHVYQFLLDEMQISKAVIFYKTDNNGNSALHLAAMLYNTQSWSIPGPALQTQWEIKWYQFVENSMPPKFFVRRNLQGQTAWDIFRETHKDLVKEAGEWLNKTSQSCSVVAILIATVAFTASAAIPGGVRSDTGIPTLEKQPAFSVFAIASLVALCFSISSVLMFLVFFTSRYRERDFGTNLPMKFLVELTSLLISIAAVLVSFCAAHFFVIKDNLKFTAFALYAVTFLPVALYALWQFPTYFDMAMATFKKTPQRIYDDD